MRKKHKKVGFSLAAALLAISMMTKATPALCDDVSVEAGIGETVTIISGGGGGSSRGLIGEGSSEIVADGQTGGAQNGSSTRAYVPPDNPVEQAYRAAASQLTLLLDTMLARAREAARGASYVGLDTAKTDLIGVAMLQPTNEELARLVNASLIVNNLRGGGGGMGNRYGGSPSWFGNYGLAHYGFEQDASLDGVTDDEMAAIRSYFGGLVGQDVGIGGIAMASNGPRGVSANPSASPMIALPRNPRLSALLPGEVTWNMIRPDLFSGGARQNAYPYGAYTGLGAYLPDGYELPAMFRPSLPSGIDASGWGLIGLGRIGGIWGDGSGGGAGGGTGSGSGSGSVSGASAPDDVRGTPTPGASSGSGSGASGAPTPGVGGGASGGAPSGGGAGGDSGSGSGSSGDGPDGGSAAGTATSIVNTASFVYVHDYRLTSCGEIVRANTVYESDVRYWTVYGADGGVIAERRTEEPRLIFVSYEPGDYVIEAYRQATYETQRLVYYRDLEYLVDADTSQLLNFRESEERPVNVHATVTHELVPTGERFRIHVMEDGAVEIESDRRGGIERVE